METSDQQLKHTRAAIAFRQILLVCSCVAGCEQHKTSSETGVPGVTASVGHLTDSSHLPTDGQTVGGGLRPEKTRSTFDNKKRPSILEPDPSIDPVVREAFHQIEWLRGQDRNASGAAALELRRRRNRKIIAIAGQILARTLPSQQSGVDDSVSPLFNRAIREILEARLELAVSGEESDIQALYDDVKALTSRDRAGEQAALGVFTLARFAHEMASRHGTERPEYLDLFVRWSLEFAGRFPHQEQRAVSLLLGSGRSCELHAYSEADDERRDQLFGYARQLYETLVTNWPSTEGADEAIASLRRRQLPGRDLVQFSGTTLTGQRIDASQLKNVVTVIYFWSSQDPEFVDSLMPLLRQADEVSDGQLRFVGVPLDSDLAVVTRFLRQNSLPGAQLFDTDSNHTGWNSPLVRFWGICRASTCWLVDRDGRVATVDVTYRTIVEDMRKLFPVPNDGN